jgi:transcriptional regulator with XRE-family HTH domain
LASDKHRAVALRELRLYLELSGAEMAKRLNLDRTTVWSYENNQLNFGHAALLRLARVASDNGRPDLACVFLEPITLPLGVSPQYVVDGMRRAA